MTNEENMGLAWEHRLALRLPRPLLFGASIIVVCLSAAYLSFQWFFGFRVDASAFGMEVFLVVVLIAPAYFFGPYDHKQYETEVKTFYIALAVIRNSRFAGAVGILVSIGLWELIQVSQGENSIDTWTRLHGGSAVSAMFLLLGWISGYFLSAGIWNRPGPQTSDIDLLNLENIYVIGRREVIPGVHRIGDMNVNVGPGWSTVPGTSSTLSSSSRTWTYGGVAHDRLILIPGVKNIDAIITGRDSQQALPVLRPDTPQDELEELAQFVIQTVYGGNATVSAERPRAQLSLIVTTEKTT